MIQISGLAKKYDEAAAHETDGASTVTTTDTTTVKGCQGTTAGDMYDQSARGMHEHLHRRMPCHETPTT